MKTIIIKSILTLIITLFVLPMMSQDFMIIHFKDGTLKTFYFNTIVELSTSPYDGDGVKHVDIQYQHVKTNYDEFVYDINAMDSISFTKYNDIKEEENFTSTMTNVLPQLSDCETINDVKNMLDNINESEGVEKAWIDGELLKIKVKDGLTISFNFDTSDIWDVPLDDADSFVEKTMARAKQVPINSDSPFKVAIAHQQFNDLLGMYPRFRKKADKLKSDFEKEGIRCDFFQPQLDFFYDNVKDHNAKQLSIYDYDLVLLTTHGIYDENWNIHGFLTGTELGRYPQIGNSNYSPNDNTEGVLYSECKKKFDKIFNEKKYKDCQAHIDLGFQREVTGYHKKGDKRLPQYYWVAYVIVLESFFKDVAIGEFTNPNSILYNAACRTLIGGHNMADIFQTYRKLGTYLGYTESNWFGPEAGLTYFGNMLNGLSSEKSYEELANVKMDEWSDDRSSHVTGTMKDEYHRVFTDKSSQTTYRDYTASLEFVSPKEDGHTPIFLFPPHTEQIEPKTANKEYSQTQTVTVKGVATIFNYNEDADIKFGFLLTYNDPVAHSREIEAHVVSVDNNKVEFEATFNYLEPNRNYTYCAFTNDGLYYNYGKPFSFKIEKPAETDVITFADPKVKAICVVNWDTNGDGELSKKEAAAVKSLEGVFRENNEITSFDELQYFTGLTSIYDFRNCTSLTSVIIPPNVTGISAEAFMNCSNLSSLNIPNSVKAIGRLAFANCSDLTTITIPQSVTTIERQAFYNCSVLVSVNVEEGNLNYTSEKGVLYNKNKTTIICYPSGKTETSYTIPHGVTSIEEYAFDVCANLTTINIPSTVNSIGDCAFYYSNITSIVIPDGVTSISKGTFALCRELTSVTIPSSVTTIGSNAFYKCEKLDSLTIPNGVVSIESEAFSCCSNLSSIVIPNSVTNIGVEAFRNCTRLASITLPNSLQSIGGGAFEYCITREIISYMKEPIEGSFFYNCYDIATLYVPAGTKAKYQATEGWKYFKNIVEMTE